jgi:7,8-dihydroneopterin aldolase/epimerase/oxygenase
MPEPSAPSLVRIAMRDFETQAHVGLHAWERHPERTTRLIVNVRMEIAVNAYYQKAGGFIDYDPLHAHLRGWANRPHTDYLETLVEDAVAFIFATTPAERCAVRIEKPDIFNDVDRIGIEYDVTRADWDALQKSRA